MPKSESSVELRPAYTWDCPRCEKTNFAHAIIPELPPELEAEFKADGFTVADLAAAAEMPAQIRCKACGRYYDSRPWGEDVVLENQADGQETEST